MQSNWTKKENAQGVLEVIVEGDEWSKAQKKVFNQLKNSMSLKGFRKGQIPASMIKRMVPEKELLTYAVDEIANKALREGVDEHKIELIASPELEIVEATPEKAVLAFNCQVTPDVILGQYKDLPVEKDAVVVTDEDVENEVKALQNRFADWVVKEDAPAADGDQVLIDFVGTLDGVEFEGGSAENQTLVLGSHQMIPGFEEGIVGMMPEEVKDVEVTFPAEYHAADLAGKPAVFKITLHEVKEKELPEADDELIALLEDENCKTLDAYKEKSRARLEEIKNNEAENKLQAEIVAELLKNNSVDIPQVMIDNEVDNRIKQQENQLKQSGFTLEQALTATGRTMADHRAELAEGAINDLKTGLILTAVANAENLQVSEEDIQKELQELSSMYQIPMETVAKLISADSIRDNLEQTKAMDFIKAHTAKAE